MALDPSEYLPVDGSDEPAIPEGLPLAEDATVLFTLPRVSAQVTPFTYKLTLAELRGFLTPKVIVRPKVAFTAPVQASQVIIGVPLLLQVTATSAVGIQKVEFYFGTELLGVGAAAGDNYTLPYTPSGANFAINLTAKAIDTAGVFNTASLFVFAVAAPVTRPVVNITAPVSGSSLIAGTSAVFKATASHASGIEKVEFFLGSASIGVVLVPNAGFYSLAYTMPTSGYVLNITAKATSVSADTALATTTVFLDPIATTVPAISGFTPTTGPAGTVVTLTGTRLSGASAVLVGGVAASSFTQLSDTSIRLTIPNFGEESIGRFSVTTGGGTALSAGAFLLDAAIAATVAPSYHGTSPSPAPSPSSVQAMVNQQWAFAPRVISYSANGTFPTFAEPASYGIRSIILDKNNFNITGDMVRTTQVYSVAGVNVSYNVYVHVNPQYDAAFTISL